MQSDPHEFVARVIGTMIMTLIAVMLIAILTLPSSPHHSIGTQPSDATAHSSHMTYSGAQ